MKFLRFFSICLLFGNVVLAQVKTPKALNKITAISANYDPLEIGEDSLLTKFIKIELIGKKLFLDKKKSAVNFVVSDSAKFRKKRGVISLPTKKGIRKFVDRDPADETKQEFFYLGQIPFLDAYIVHGLYWETLDFKFISKTDGEEIQSFGDFPHVSANKKFIISIYADPYSTEANLELFAIENRKITTIFSASFKHWMPASDQEMFWSSDGNYYLPIRYSSEYWKKDGNLNDNFKYIKISLR
ncbi:hypothetical protein [Flavobacterium sp.]|uniref:hypothetical protein n=1 Tax=Flavobacterium sp. TaxID=239 RepID=UPI00120A99D3|nr:hypothetical protein [Flavobacterium sp.]RZJ73857.1 MAG: hypothetical protein EOO49_00430 [Flavobacterium sp.]